MHASLQFYVLCSQLPSSCLAHLGFDLKLFESSTINLHPVRQSNVLLFFFLFSKMFFWAADETETKKTNAETWNETHGTCFLSSSGLYSWSPSPQRSFSACVCWGWDRGVRGKGSRWRPVFKHQNGILVKRGFRSLHDPTPWTIMDQQYINYIVYI